MTFSYQVIKELLAGSVEQRLALKDAYGGVPTTRCQRRTDCCSLLPEMSLLEALAAIQRLLDMPLAKRQEFCKGLIRYFFLNPVEIVSCPFIKDQDCMIYEDRFFGCRAYGLWSRRYYEEQVAHSQQAKQLAQKQWRELGIALPQEVVNFHLPYCPYVEMEENVSVDDRVILAVSDAIEEFSGQLAPWHDTFYRRYFSDLSFLVASLTFTMQTAVQLKYEMVRDIIATGSRGRLEKIVNELTDLCADLT